MPCARSRATTDTDKAPTTISFNEENGERSYVYLTDEEKRILDGDKGEAARLALSILVDLGKLYGAETLMPVSQVHIDATLYMVDAGLQFAEKMASLGAKAAVPTSLNPSAIDLIRWKELRVPPEELIKHQRLASAYLTMQATPTWTCAPYQQGIVPRFGEQIAWGESNAIAFANSVIGARTNRYADLMDICAAIIGKVPKFGLHLKRNRKAKLLIELKGFTTPMFENEALYPLLGCVVGEIASDQVAAVSGIPSAVTFDNLKGFLAGAASSGAVALCHLVGITPEAQDVEMCFQGDRPKRVLQITPKMVADHEQRLQSAKDDNIDWITVGCPHYSPAEFTQLLRLVEGKRVHQSVAFWVFTSRTVYAWIKENSILKQLTDAGISVFTDGCPLQYPRKSWNFSAAMTDSAKFANYCYSQTGLPVIFGSLEDCVESAVTGKIQRRKSPWAGN
ncbi:MAG: aconitase X catalytic domain-containing protein [Deltaproteobacteria bacterium]|nr:aconitase X catalytic domain-containing protein [Deltaproteobacteria bacterium]